MNKPPIKQKILKSPEDLEDLWEEYKSFIDSNPEITQVATGKGVQEILSKKPYQRSGFESYVYKNYRFHVHQYIDNTTGAYDAYLGIVTHMRNEWSTDLIEGTLTGRYKAPNLTNRLLGLVDKNETNVNLRQTSFIPEDLTNENNDSH